MSTKSSLSSQRYPSFVSIFLTSSRVSHQLSKFSDSPSTFSSTFTPSLNSTSPRTKPKIWYSSKNNSDSKLKILTVSATTTAQNPLETSFISPSSSSSLSSNAHHDDCGVQPQGSPFFRPSKIVCTLGPKTCDVDSIYKLWQTGMTVVRLNMSHGTHEWHSQVMENVRTVNNTLIPKGMVQLSMLLDTKGPEVRSGDLKEPIQVNRGQRFVWTIRKDKENFDKFMTDVSYDDFVNDVKKGDTLLIDGGISSFLVTEVTDTDVISECIDGGVLTSRRHLNVRGKSASLPAITQKDWEDINLGIQNNIDFYALSFVKHEDDVLLLKDYFKKKGVNALILPKIESALAVPRLQQILEVSDGAMVARGDLGAEIFVEDVPIVQEEIIRINRQLKKPTIVATHMLESMIVYPTPTRAEVTDITEALKQGTDATMLSGETANGSYPVQALTVMDTVAKTVYTQRKESPLDPPPFAHADGKSSTFRSDIAYSAAVLAKNLKAAAIIVFTRAGKYAIEISSVRPHCPIIAFSPDEELEKRLTLFWGVHPLSLDLSSDPEVTIKNAIEVVKRNGIARSKDALVIVSDILAKDDISVNTVQVRVVR